MKLHSLMTIVALALSTISASSAGILTGSLFGLYGGRRHYSPDDQEDNAVYPPQCQDEGMFRQSEGHESLRVVCDVNGRSVSAVIDTGAQISIMSTGFARHCALFDKIDKRFAGRAVGVGSSEILGQLNSLTVRLGGLQFKSDFSVLSNTNVDFIIGLDILRKFQSDVCLRENIIKMFHQNKVFRVPISSRDINCLSYGLSSQDQGCQLDDLNYLPERRSPYRGIEAGDDIEDEFASNSSEDLLSMEGV